MQKVEKFSIGSVVTGYVCLVIMVLGVVTLIGGFVVGIIYSVEADEDTYDKEGYCKVESFAIRQKVCYKPCVLDGQIVERCAWACWAGRWSVLVSDSKNFSAVSESWPVKSSIHAESQRTRSNLMSNLEGHPIGSVGKCWYDSSSHSDVSWHGSAELESLMIALVTLCSVGEMIFLCGFFGMLLFFCTGCNLYHYIQNKRRRDWIQNKRRRDRENAANFPVQNLEETDGPDQTDDL